MSIDRFVRDEGAATAIEYGILTALVAVVLTSSLTFLHSELSHEFSTLAVAIHNAGA